MTKSRNILIYILFGLLIQNNVYSSNPSERRIIPLSQSEKTTDRFRFDLNSHIADIIYRHPALYELQNHKGHFFDDVININDSLSADSIPFRRTSVCLRYADSKISGDFLPYNGNSFIDTEVLANAIYGTSNYGTIFGSISFSKGLHAGYAWNAIRDADLYLPYIISDSTGGDYRYENYYVAGGYSFHLNRLYYGVEGSIKGEIASRQTDPRCANTLSYLTLRASATLPLDSGDALSLSASYIRNKQYLHLLNWRPNQQDRFFVTYGFGYYDLQESPVSFGIRRMYYIEGVNTKLTYSNIGKNKNISPDITADLEYVLLSMKTEEASAKNLFGSTTHHFNGSLWLAFVKNSTLEYTVGVQTQNRLRKGKENIYEAYRPDENYPSIYDYRLVGTRSRYTSIVSQNMLQGKINYNLTDNFTLEALLGVGADYLSERYSLNNQHWYVISAYPSLGIGAKHRTAKAEWGVDARLFMHIPINYDYKVEYGEFRLDYQTTFLPYAFHTDRSVSVLSGLYFSYPITKNGQKAGISLKYYIRRGSRPIDVIYNGTPGVVSHLLSNPSTEKIHNNEYRINATLFIEL